MCRGVSGKDHTLLQTRPIKRQRASNVQHALVRRPSKRDMPTGKDRDRRNTDRPTTAQ